MRALYRLQATLSTSPVPEAGPFYCGDKRKTAQRSLLFRWANIVWIAFRAALYSSSERTQWPEGSNTDREGEEEVEERMNLL